MDEKLIKELIQELKMLREQIFSLKTEFLGPGLHSIVHVLEEIREKIKS